MGLTDAKQAAKAAPAAGELAVAEAEGPNFYCLNKDHASRLVTIERMFHYAGEVYPDDHPQAGQLALVDQGFGLDPVPDLSKAPVCPVCTGRNQVVDPLTGKARVVRVSAIPLEYDESGEPQIPVAVMSIAARAGEA